MSERSVTMAEMQPIPADPLSEDMPLSIRQLTITRQTIHQVVGEYRVIEPPFDRPSLHDEAFEAFARILSANPLTPLAWCGRLVGDRLRQGLEVDAWRRKGFPPKWWPLMLGGMPVNALHPRSPAYRALQRLAGVDMDEVIVVAALGDRAREVIGRLFGGDR